jgi:hypothetical protein
MVNQNVRNGGERQSGINLFVLETHHILPNIVKLSRGVGFLVERKKSALRPWRNADFFKIII